MTDKDKEKKEAKAEDKKAVKKDDKAAKTKDKDAKADKKGKDSKDNHAKSKEDKPSLMSKIKGKFAFLSKKKKSDKNDPKNNNKPKKVKKVKPKKEKKEEPKVPFIDNPSKKEKPSIYIHKVVKLDNKNNNFTDKKFQQIHELSKSSDVIKSFHRIGMSLNNVNLADVPRDYMDKVCYVLINNYKSESDSLGVGPLNDAYLFSKIHKKLGYKIVFLINPDKLSFIKTLEFFVKHTMTALTIYYSGRDSSSRQNKTSHGIQFNGESIVYSSVEFGKLVADNSNGMAKILIISDCGCGGTVFSMKAAQKTENTHCSPMVSFVTDKKDLEPKERRRSQGLFTYYFCKLLRQFPNSTPNEMVSMLNESFERFGVEFRSLVSIDDLADQPMFPDATLIFTGQPPPPDPNQPVSEKPTTEAMTIANQ